MKLPLSQANHGPISIGEQPWALQLTNGSELPVRGRGDRGDRQPRLNYFCLGLELGRPLGLPGPQVQAVDDLRGARPATKH